MGIGKKPIPREAISTTSGGQVEPKKSAAHGWICRKFTVTHTIALVKLLHCVTGKKGQTIFSFPKNIQNTSQNLTPTSRRDKNSVKGPSQKP